MPTITPIMPATVPCDGMWHKIYTTSGVFGHVFVRYNSTTCIFTARLVDDPPPPPPPGLPVVVKKELGIPIGGGWRGLNALFERFEVKCEQPAGGPPHTPPHTPPPDNPTQQEQYPAQTQTGRRRRRAQPPPLPDCDFEWYVIV